MDIKQLKIVGSNGEILQSVVPEIKSYSSKSGAEGTAFFVGKQFVVKYFERVGLEYSLFDNYCKEIKSFNEAGLNYPKIYSWATLPICAEDNVYKYYILQEQMAGDILYPHSMSSIHSRCSTFCSKSEFDEALGDIETHKALYARILEEYSRIYLEQNMMLENVSDEQIFKFAQTYFDVNKRALYLDPDLHPGNVMFDGKTLTMIDGSICYRHPGKWLTHKREFNTRRYVSESIDDILTLFSCNRHAITRLIDYHDAGGQRLSVVENNLRQNEILLGEILERWVQVLMQMSKGSELTLGDVSLFHGEIADLVPESKSKAILESMEKSI